MYTVVHDERISLYKLNRLPLYLYCIIIVNYRPLSYSVSAFLAGSCMLVSIVDASISLYAVKSAMASLCI
jgi:hypothetical protein